MWPIPQINDDNRAFWTGGQDGELLIARCDDCGYYIHPPTPRCPRCLERRTSSRARSADAAASTPTRSTSAPWSPGIEVPYVIAIVALDEQSDLRLMTNIVGCAPDEVAIDMPVQVEFRRAGRRLRARVQAGVTMAESFEQRCIISGIGQSEVGRRVTRGVMALTLDACIEAIADAGLSPRTSTACFPGPGRSRAPRAWRPAARDRRVPVCTR